MCTHRNSFVNTLDVNNRTTAGLWCRRCAVTAIFAVRTSPILVKRAVKPFEDISGPTSIRTRIIRVFAARAFDPTIFTMSKQENIFLFVPNLIGKPKLMGLPKSSIPVGVLRSSVGSVPIRMSVSAF